MFELPTRSTRVYRGKFPHSVNSVGLGSSRSSPSQAYVAGFLDIKNPVHIELNCGRRFIACSTEVREMSSYLYVDIQEMLITRPTPIERLSQERYDEMLAGIRLIRGF